MSNALLTWPKLSRGNAFVYVCTIQRMAVDLSSGRDVAHRGHGSVSLRYSAPSPCLLLRSGGDLIYVGAASFAPTSIFHLPTSDLQLTPLPRRAVISTGCPRQRRSRSVNPAMAKGCARAKTSEATLLATSTGKSAQVGSRQTDDDSRRGANKGQHSAVRRRLPPPPSYGRCGVVKCGLATDSPENSRLRPEHPAHGAIGGPGSR